MLKIIWIAFGVCEVLRDGFACWIRRIALYKGDYAQANQSLREANRLMPKRGCDPDSTLRHLNRPLNLTTPQGRMLLTYRQGHFARLSTGTESGKGEIPCRRE